eukprot:TRINITY_DN14180_c0_g1_i1.p1 TRINITY_DN14180_c0_g1~~TRINITY_DN14180_c0_g1_i1.p1  ORF type:complete len:537 (-),score=102.62 TRINITY_DN14180_c0_g1_i1:136-1746(-)
MGSAPSKLRKVRRGLARIDLWEAAETGNEERVTRLVNKRRSLVNLKDHEFCTPLHRAVRAGHLPITLFLIEHDADVNLCSVRGLCPLHFAIMSKRNEIVLKLLDLTDPRICDVEGRSFLHFIIQYSGTVHEFEQLIARGSATDPRDKAGNTLMHYCAMFNRTEIAEKLLSTYEVDLEETNTSGETPLHKAAVHESLAMVELLLAAGANPLARTTSGAQPHAVCCTSSDASHLMRILADNGISMLQQQLLAAQACNVALQKKNDELTARNKLLTDRIVAASLEITAQPPPSPSQTMLDNSIVEDDDVSVDFTHDLRHIVGPVVPRICINNNSDSAHHNVQPGTPDRPPRHSMSSVLVPPLAQSPNLIVFSPFVKRSVSPYQHRPLSRKDLFLPQDQQLDAIDEDFEVYSPRQHHSYFTATSSVAGAADTTATVVVEDSFYADHPNASGGVHVHHVENQAPETDLTVTSLDGSCSEVAITMPITDDLNQSTESAVSAHITMRRKPRSARGSGRARRDIFSENTAGNWLDSDPFDFSSM